MPEKLVRDHIIDIIKKNGEECRYRIELDEDKYRRLLDLKFSEEVEELALVYGKEGEIEEFADVIEVVRAFAKHCPFTFHCVLALAGSEADKTSVYGQHYADIHREWLFNRLRDQVRHLPCLPTAVLHTWATSVLSTLHLMLRHRGIDIESVLDCMAAKKAERGGFTERVVLITE